MPLEIELKLRVESHEPVRERLQSLGAAYLSRVLESNSIFDRPDGSLRKRGIGLRLRRTVSQDDGEVSATLTLKGPRLEGQMKSREELEVLVDQAETTARILETLGLVPILRYQKRRESWELSQCRVELDEPPHIGIFVEIEGPDESRIRAAQKSLGLDRIAHQQESYVRMLLEYCAERGITDRIVDLP
ncbi:MAG: class IV adenylate cyclase [Phycisphaerales bacterium]|nr:MAG: class IV adenylate cyclase [Phycisphaerales bacterium]